MAPDATAPHANKSSVTPLAPADALTDGWSAWRPHLAVAWRAFWVSRAIVWGAGLLAIALAGVSDARLDFDPQGLTRPFGPLADLLVAPGARWDSYWFLSIAQDGYGGDRAAFFPLYPLLVAATGGLLGGLAVSAVAFVGALAVVHRLAALELGEPEARLAVLALALFPGALFFSAVYSESVYLFVSAGSVYAARTGHWAWAGVLGALAASSRSAGLLVAVALGLLWWSQRPRRLHDAGWIALVPAGLGVFCLYLALAGHDAGAPFAAQATWHREFAGPLAGAWDGAVAAFDGTRQLLSGSRSPVYFEQAGGDPFDVAGHNLELFAFLVAAVPAVAGTLRRLPLAYGAYVAAALSLPLSWPVGPQPLMSLPRFLAVLFPLFMWLGWWLARGGPARRGVVLGGFAITLALASARFSTWHWFA